METRALVPCLAFVLAAGLDASARAGTLKVPQQFATISAAVAAAGSGDTVLVSKGSYPGNVLIDSKTNVTLRAKGKVRVLGQPALTATIFINTCTNVVVRGFQIEPVDGVTGVSVLFGSGVTLDKCRIEGGASGIIVSQSDRATITRCSVLDSSTTGIDAESAHLTVLRCTLTRTGNDGISFTSANARIVGNKLSHIGDDGITPGDSDGGGLIADNRLTDVVEVAIGSTSGFDVTVVGNRVKRAGLGVDADGGTMLIADNRFANCSVAGVKALSGSITTERNRMNRCATGILLGGGASSSVHSQNRIQRSASNGIELSSGADHNTFTRNVVKKSGGFDLFDGSGQSNTFIDNAFTFVGP